VFLVNISVINDMFKINNKQYTLCYKLIELIFKYQYFLKGLWQTNGLGR
jgi:hypothetical protein